MDNKKNINKAKKLYESGIMLKEIADTLKVPEGTVRSWKNRYKWVVADGATLQKVIRRCTRVPKALQIDDGTKQTLQNKKLTEEQQMFCVYYSKSFNATQSYVKAYGCTYDSAKAHGYELLQSVAVREEILRLKEMKRLQIIAGADDIVEKQMRIAFSDIGDYLTFGREEVAVMGAFGQVMAEDENGEKKALTKIANTVKFNESCNLDTSIIQEVKQGRDGVSIKLADAQKAMDWLAKYFMINPMDVHKKEFDDKRLELEVAKVEMSVKDTGSKEEITDDGFIEALNGSASEAWANYGD